VGASEPPLSGAPHAVIEPSAYNSTTHTKYEQGAWWQVDLGEEKNINQIIIYKQRHH
jgi:hypothetical protein